MLGDLNSGLNPNIIGQNLEINYVVDLENFEWGWEVEKLERMFRGMRRDHHNLGEESCNNKGQETTKQGIK